MTSTKDYLGGMEYSDGTLEAVYHAEGRLVPKSENNGPVIGTSDKYSYEYTLKDHLGNSRVMFSDLDENGSVDASEILQVEGYYPFGLGHEGLGDVQVGVENQYKFNGTELIDDFDLGWHHTFYRSYSPDLGRWYQIDPKGNERESSYVGMANNPVVFSDMLGDTIIGEKIVTYNRDVNGDQSVKNASDLGLTTLDYRNITAVYNETTQSYDVFFEVNIDYSTQLNPAGSQNFENENPGISLEVTEHEDGHWEQNNEALNYSGYSLKYSGETISGQLDDILSGVGVLYGQNIDKQIEEKGLAITQKERRTKIDQKVNRVLVNFWETIADVKHTDALGTDPTTGQRYSIERDANERMFTRGKVDRNDSYSTGTKAKKPTYNGKNISGY